MGYIQSFNRRETKYLLSQEQMAAFLREARNLLSRDKYGEYTICNLYLDTDDFYFIEHSLDRPAYKEKLRIRSYGNADRTDKIFFEIKKKAKGVVYKRRISMPQLQAENALIGKAALPDSQIGSEITYALDFYQNLQPSVFLSYEREAFFEKNGGDFRVTFDENICYRQSELTLNSAPWGMPILKPDQVLMELKTSGGLPLWMVQALSKEKIFKASFSKYGTAYKDIIKTNQKGVRKYA